MRHRSTPGQQLLVVRLVARSAIVLGLVVCVASMFVPARSVAVAASGSSALLDPIPPDQWPPNIPDKGDCGELGRWVKFTAGGGPGIGKTANSGSPKMTAVYDNVLVPGAGQTIVVRQVRADGSSTDQSFERVSVGIADVNPTWSFAPTTVSPTLSYVGAHDDKNFSQFALCVDSVVVVPTSTSTSTSVVPTSTSTSTSVAPTSTSTSTSIAPTSTSTSTSTTVVPTSTSTSTSVAPTSTSTSVAPTSTTRAPETTTTLGGTTSTSTSTSTPTPTVTSTSTPGTGGPTIPAGPTIPQPVTGTPGQPPATAPSSAVATGGTGQTTVAVSVLGAVVTAPTVAVSVAGAQIDAAEPIAFTGSSSSSLGLIGGLLVLAGTALLTATRRVRPQ